MVRTSVSRFRWIFSLLLCGICHAADQTGSRDKSYSIALPHYESETQEEAFSKAMSASKALEKVASDTLDILEDSSLKIEQRLQALYVAERFDTALIAPRLIACIDLKDSRGAFLRDRFRGRYPLIGVLKKRGSSTSVYLVRALRKESDPLRVAMICDVLKAVAGEESALVVLQKEMSLDGMTEEERTALRRACDQVTSKEKGYSDE